MVQLGNALFRARTQFSVDLHPSTVGNVEEGVKEQLNAHLLRYVDEIKGVMLAYSNLDIITKKPLIHPYFPYFHLEVRADVLVFRPSPGMNLVARVTLLGEDYISALALGVFNVTIPTRSVMAEMSFLQEENKWIHSQHPQNQIEEGTYVVFQVEEMRDNAGFCQITGNLKDPGTGAVSYLYPGLQLPSGGGERLFDGFNGAGLPIEPEAPDQGDLGVGQGGVAAATGGPAHATNGGAVTGGKDKKRRRDSKAAPEAHESDGHGGKRAKTDRMVPGEVADGPAVTDEAGTPAAGLRPLANGLLLLVKAAAAVAAPKGLAAGEEGKQDKDSNKHSDKKDRHKTSEKSEKQKKSKNSEKDKKSEKSEKDKKSEKSEKDKKSEKSEKDKKSEKNKDKKNKKDPHRDGVAGGQETHTPAPAAALAASGAAPAHGRAKDEEHPKAGRGPEGQELASTAEPAAAVRVDKGTGGKKPKDKSKGRSSDAQVPATAAGSGKGPDKDKKRRKGS